VKPQVLPTRRYRKSPDDLTRVPPRPKKLYKVASFALGGRQLNWLADTSGKLAAREGINRSAIVRAAIDLLAERFASGTAEDLALYIERCARDDRDLMNPPFSEESSR
jgi:hypothetical protein